MKFVSSMIVPCSCHILFELSIEWSLHTRSEHWQHFQSVILSLAVGQIEHLPWVQNGPVGFEKTNHM
jgi:hypothetical protein